ncbi:MAG: cytochrome c nitrite reductase small subunit [Deltaproteobacteria bacterium]|nr:cytochrome c nitrite reductase small subunit [Deltaproteobacteria bacterium]
MATAGQPPPKQRRWGLALLLILLVAVAAGSFLAFGPPGLYARSESPEFCGSCHVMDTQYESWFHSAHRRAKCVDCHLPNDSLARHLFWKGVDGIWDTVAFHTGRFAEDIRISNHGARVVQENCVRCHAETVARISTDRNCWECHRRLSHKRTGAVATLTP